MANRFNIPDQEYYMRRYINDLPKERNLVLEDDLNLIDGNLAWQDNLNLNLASADYTSCHNLNPNLNYPDDFLRADSNDLGLDWQQFYETSAPTLGTNLFSISTNALRMFNDINAGLGTKGAWLNSFPATSTHQISSMIFKQSILVPPVINLPNVQFDITGGGPCVRMSNQGGGTGWQNNVKCYNLYYQENRSRISPYPITQAVLWLDHISVIGVNPLRSIIISPLVAGDELKLTAMNFIDPTLGPALCLKIFVNNIQKGTTVTLYQNFNSTYIGTGRVGIGGSVYDSDNDFAIDWESWSGATAIPV